MKNLVIALLAIGLVASVCISVLDHDGQIAASRENERLKDAIKELLKADETLKSSDLVLKTSCDKLQAANANLRQACEVANRQLERDIATFKRMR